MQTEIEAKFLSIDHTELRTKLHEAGAACEQPMRLMRRKIYDFPDGKLDKIDAWVRLRDEGAMITLSYKQQQSKNLHGTKEAIVTVDNFEMVDSILLTIGLVQKAYHETKRESWTLDGVHIDLDEWPWVKPYIEVEGTSAAAVSRIASLLGLAMDQAVYGAAVPYLAEYEVTEDEVNRWPEILFKPVPEWLKQRRRV
jgi:adenylate cyclase, class 2